MSIISNLKNIRKTLLQTEARDSVESEMNKAIIMKNTKWYQEHKQPTKQKRNDSNKHKAFNSNFNCQWIQLSKLNKQGS